jgi:uncharacterized protein (UPF0332 family)
MPVVWNPCVNRLYYACFYAVSALLLRHGFSSSKHTGVRSLFNRHFVKTGKISKALAQIYNDLFARRQESDRNVSIVLRHFFLKITVEAFPPPVAPACVLLGRQAY